MVYWIREFKNSKTGKRVRVYSEAQDIPSLRREAANHFGDQGWLDDQIYKYDARLDMKRDGRHPLTIEKVR